MNNTSVDDLNYSLDEGGSGKKAAKRKAGFDINLGQIEKDKMH
jgi:hypothetical protein